RNWTLSKEEYEDLSSKGEIYFSKNGDGVPRLKIYESSETYSIQSSLFTDVHTSITGKNEL
ncbi:restriction endonuclease, partial [Candidatus Falkowbacteria bacterium CG_4_10_14_0_2_um_filter_41_15]